mmetsp:Transcript_38366/g.46846  ORF Transcript_38366/g.46846 Transcript_38366/m.46846 type:complete len:122 (+) Transcript_38366:200-565(+)
MALKYIHSIMSMSINRFFVPAPQLCLSGLQHVTIPTASPNRIADVNDASGSGNRLFDAIWFAVPKKRVSRSRKRKKTTVQKRLKLKHNIVLDGRTGELTLRHRLPLNWERFLPDYEVKRWD